MNIIKKSSREIIKRLNEGASQNQLIKEGYPESTVVYHYRRLFHPERHKRFMKQVSSYQNKEQHA